MSDEPKRRVRSWGWIVWTALLAPPILYVLAAGPLEWMCDHGYLSREPTVTMYAPLRWAREKSDAFRWLTDRYIGLFLRR